MRWLVTKERMLIPERSIVKIGPRADGGATATTIDQMGRIGAVELEWNYEQCVRELNQPADLAPEPAGSAMAGKRAPAH
jgi:hypothetical protein